MRIHVKLTLQFIGIVAVILTLSSIAIYYFSSSYRHEDFYKRLEDKATNVAQLLIKVEEIDASLLKIIEQNNRVSLPDERIIIFNYRDEIIYCSSDTIDLYINQHLINSIRLNDEVRFTRGTSEVLGFLFSDQYDRFVVIAAATDIHGLKKMKNLRMVLLIVFGSSIILICIAGSLYARRALAPISKVIDQVDEITITNLDKRLEEGTQKDEISKLAHTFNKMLDRLESAFKVQKNFIANASHELRTPLTSITGQLDVVLMKKRTAEEYRETMESVLDDMKSLNNTSNRLLLLAQTSSEASDVMFSDIRLDDLIWQSRSECIKRNKDYAIYVSLDDRIDDESKLTIKGNEQLIKTVLSNLMDNACKFSEKHEVWIKVTTETGDRISVSFTDNGIGIDSQDIKQIFEPFHRSKNALAFKGHGIGLSLVQRIISIHHGTILVKSKINEGSVFTIAFPVLPS